MLDSIAAPLELSGPVAQLIYNLKYQHDKPAAHFLGRLLAYTAIYPDFEAITAIPLHAARQRYRGYNQAAEIGKIVAQELNKPFLSLIKKNHSTTAQALVKNRDLRLTHLQHVFQPADYCPYLPASVLLIDDVVTTGTTLNEGAKVLKDIGIKQVHGMAVAHGG